MLAPLFIYLLSLISFSLSSAVSRREVQVAPKLQSFLPAVSGFWYNEAKDRTGNCECYCNRTPRIVGGRVVDDPQRYPFMVAILSNIVCGGVLITTRHVITAGHCVIGFQNERPKVLLGTVNLRQKNVVMGVQSMKVHEFYDDYEVRNDIGIITMDGHIHSNDEMRPACLPYINTKDYKTGEKLTAVGFGYTNQNTQQADGLLRRVKVPTIEHENCTALYRLKHIDVHDNTICAGFYEGGKDACDGDSGGPLIQKDHGNGKERVVGLVSWGIGCARPYLPGVYTRVKYHLDWIMKNTDNLCICQI